MILLKSINKIIGLFTLVGALVISVGVGAYAAPRGVDVFAIKTNLQNKTPIPVTNWFAKYDELREKYHPSDGDKVVLTRPLMQQAERVQQWTDTANRISKNYSLLSKAIRNLPPAVGVPEVKEYRDLMADWYQDAASVYMELIKPRPPARTIEDLGEQLDIVKKRSDSLAHNIADLKAMDRNIRQQYNVPIAPQEDIIRQFAMGKK